MSGPVTPEDRRCEDKALAGIELRERRQAQVGGLPITRVLPTKGRRTVGPSCFVDLAGPSDAEEPDPMEVGPHPDIGLSTVTWLLEGENIPLPGRVIVTHTEALEALSGASAPSSSSACSRTCAPTAACSSRCAVTSAAYLRRHPEHADLIDPTTPSCAAGCLDEALPAEETLT